MSKKAIGLPLAAIILAGGFGLATIEKASADAITSRCANEWKAAKANGATGGKGWKEFFDQCSADQLGVGRGLTISGEASPQQLPAAAAPTESAPPALAPAATAVATPAPAAPPTPPKKPDTKMEASATRQFATEADAKAKCPSGEVVWLNTTTKKVQLPGREGYGKGKRGAYMCEADAAATGAHAAKMEKQL